MSVLGYNETDRELLIVAFGMDAMPDPMDTGFAGADCMTCESEILTARGAAGNFSGSLIRMFPNFCACGNKRCPRSTHHANDCTGSNEPGQAGSWY